MTAQPRNLLEYHMNEMIVRRTAERVAQEQRRTATIGQPPTLRHRRIRLVEQ